MSANRYRQRPTIECVKENIPHAHRMENSHFSFVFTVGMNCVVEALMMSDEIWLMCF